MAPSVKPAIAVLGSGAWGTALSVLLAQNGHPVLLWGNDPAQLARLARERTNNVSLPGVSWPPSIQVEPDMRALTHVATRLLIAVPSHAFRATLTALAPPPGATIAWATKGLEPGSGKLLSIVMDEVLGRERARGVISGPTFAGELARGLPSALTVASEQESIAEAIAEWLRGECVRVYTSRDLIGVQLGGAVKNVLAIAAGISDGLAFGANARAALITRGLAEMRRLGVRMGGVGETFMGLTGVGDLVLTCTDDASRNRRVGLGLGRGGKLAEVLAQVGQEAEGVATARELHQLAQRLKVDMPITEQVYRVLYENAAPQAAVEALLAREPRAE